MPNKSGRISEAEVALATMQFLRSQPGHEASIDEIVSALPGYLMLGADDQAQSATRPNEQMWEQQVRNIVSHKAASGNAIHDGYLEHVPPGRLRLTSAGETHLKNAG